MFKFEAVFTVVSRPVFDQLLMVVVADGDAQRYPDHRAGNKVGEKGGVLEKVLLQRLMLPDEQSVVRRVRIVLVLR